LIIGLNFIPTKVYCNQKIALFGDSLMSGYGLEQKFHLSTILEKNLKEKGFDINVINASVSGDTTSGGLNRLEWLLEKRDIDIVILCLGANDMLRGINPSIIKQNLNNILEILQERNITILLAGMLSQETLGHKYKNKFDRIYPELAKKFQISFLPFLLDGVALNAELNLNDGKHPNQKGIKIISKNLEKKLTNLLHN
jgi:acyl-CoA thioesterase-1